MSATRGKDKEGQDKLTLTVGGQDKLDILKSMGPDRLHLGVPRCRRGGSWLSSSLLSTRTSGLMIQISRLKIIKGLEHLSCDKEE